MRISWNWLSEFLDLSSIKGPEGLAELLTQRGLEVESIERLNHGLNHVVSAQILECKPHPQADRLSLCQVTIGSGSVFEIVCGAQNMKVGDKVALAQVGAHLPNGVKISAGKIRGIISQGMLCSEEELKLKEKSEGILILPPETSLGLPIAEVLGRNDSILVLKVTANRSDCLSHFGIAREVGAALAQRPRYFQGRNLNLRGCPISVSLNAGEGAPQFYGFLIRGVRVGPSPKALAERLERLGIRSINNVVDATNWVLLELGHPVHAYDVQKIAGREIQVRMSREGEQLSLIGGQVLTLNGSELVIADAEKPIGLAGVMGGSNTEVTIETQDIFLECGEFNPTLIRRASLRHQIKTEASYRFERGIDPSALPDVLARLCAWVFQEAGGEEGGGISVKIASRTQVFSREWIRFGAYDLHDLLGIERESEILSFKKLEEILKNLDCRVVRENQGWRVEPPSYRLDLQLKEDLAEEIARSVGYDQIPSTLPTLSGSPIFSDSALSRILLLERTRDSLVRSGFHEAINLAFSSAAWLTQFNSSSTVPVSNPLSEEQGVLVPSLLPGLIRNALTNWSHHFGSSPLAVRLFELRPVFHSACSPIQAEGHFQTGVQENWRLALVLSGPRYAEALRGELGEVDFYDLKGVWDCLWTDLGVRGVRYQGVQVSDGPLASSANHFPQSCYHPGQVIEMLAGQQVLGYFGLLHPEKARALKIRSPLWLGELDWDLLLKFSRAATSVPTFKPWSEFPSMERDFALIVKKGIASDKVCQLAMKVGRPLAKVVKVFDIYEGSQIAEGMTSIAVRVIFYDENRSLREEETEAISARIVQSWKKDLGAELRA